MGAGRVHAKRENGAPVERIVFDRKAPVHVTPHGENHQHGYPPGARRPVKDREALDEGQQRKQKGRVGRIDDEQRPRQGRDRHCAHVDPVRRRQIAGGEREEGVAVEDQRHHPDVKHAAPQPHREREEVHFQLARLVDVGGEQRAEDRDRLCCHDCEQPRTADPLIEGRLCAP